MSETIENIKQRIRTVQHKEKRYKAVIKRLRLTLNGIVFEEKPDDKDGYDGLYNCDTHGQHED